MRDIKLKKVNIYINDQKKSISPGLVSIDKLYALTDSGEKHIFLNREGDIDIPLLPKEYILIHGDEKFVAGVSTIESNPLLRNEVRPEFNGSHNLTFPNTKITGKLLKERDDKFPQGRLFADIKDGIDMEISDDMTMVVQDKDSYFIIPSMDGDGSIDIEECSKNGCRPPKSKKYSIRIDGDKYRVSSQKITGADILALAGKNDTEWSLNQKLHGGKREKIKAEDTVDLTCPGLERFETVCRQAQQGKLANYIV